MRSIVISVRVARAAATLLAPLLALSFIGDAAAGKIYRCVDDQKKVTVSDTPCVTQPAATANAGKEKAKDGSVDAAGKDRKASPPQSKPDVKG